MSKRSVPAWIAVAAIALAQAVFVFIYRAVEAERRSSASAFTHELLPGRPLPGLVLRDVHGDAIALHELGDTPVLLHFWATWCPPCKAELPGLLELARELRARGSLRLIAVAVDPDWDAVGQFFHGAVPPEIVRDETGALAKAYEVGALPDTFFVPADRGRVLRFGGARDWQSEAARALLLRHLPTGPVVRP